MTLAIDWTPLSKMREDGFEDLLINHWELVAHDKELIPFAPDWDKYYALEKAGLFKSLCMYRQGFLVGYNCFFVHPHLHYCHSLHAINDVIYVDPGSAGHGFRIVRAAERRLKELGVVKVMYHTKLHVNLAREDRPATVGDLLLAMRYKHAENVYSKVL